MTKYKALSKKEKREHIWEYYRYHIIGGVIGILMLSNLLMTMFGPQPPDSAVSIVVMGVYRQDDEKLDQFTHQIQEIIKEDEEEVGEVEVTMFPANWEGSSPFDVAMNQKLVLMFQAKEIDVMIVEEAKFNSFFSGSDESIYEPLDSYVELAEILEKNKDKLVEIKLPDDLEKRTYGLYAKDNHKLKEIGLGDDYIISIPKISDKKDNAVKAIQWIYK